MSNDIKRALIAYVDLDMRVYVAGPDEQDARALGAPGKGHTWPVWSPEGGRLAFSGFSSGSNGLGRIGLYLHEMGEADARTLYTNEAGTDAIAQRTPHYALWAPDGRRLAFLARAGRQGLTLFSLDLTDQAPPRRLIEGMPLFLSWSPDSRFLLLHSGQDHYLVDFEGDAYVVKMPGGSRLYMAPSWSPASNQMAILREGEGERQSLLVGDTERGSTEVIAEFDGGAAFSWSPDGTMIGFVRDQQARSRLFGGLWVMAADGSGERQLSGDPVLCFFWSPGGGRIAYITPSEGAEGSLRWGVVEVENGATRYLADFQPSEEQLLVFMFFDQYAQSHSVWSPGGDRLVFSGVVGFQTESAGLSPGHEPSILIADIEGSQHPSAVAKGVLGFWSPV